MTRTLLALLLVAQAGALVYVAALDSPWTLLLLAHTTLVAIQLGQILGALAEQDCWMASFEQRHDPSVPGALPREK